MTENTQGPGKSATELFNETPSWYEEPDISPEQLDPNYVAPRTGGLGDPARPAGNPMDPGRRSELITVFVLLGVVSIAAVLLFFSGIFGSNAEFSVGDCATPVESSSAFGFAAGTDGCGAGIDLVVVGSFEPVGVDQMPNEFDPFWETGFSRCNELMTVPGIALPLPVATTDQEWADGNQLIVCSGIDFNDITDEAATVIEGLDR